MGLNALSGVRGFLTPVEVERVMAMRRESLNALSGVRGFLTQETCYLPLAGIKSLNALSGVRGFLTVE